MIFLKHFVTLKMSTVQVIGISGGSGSGKTHCADILNNSINTEFGEGTCFILGQDRFYRSLDKNVDLKNYNFDIPNALDFKHMIVCVKQIISGEEVSLPKYNFKTHSVDGYEKINLGNNLKTLIIEGILIFTVPELLELFDIKVFIDTDDDIRLKRRLTRDCVSRGRNLVSVCDQWEHTVKPSHDEYVHPSSKHADIIIPMTRNHEYTGINFLCESVILKLNTF